MPGGYSGTTHGEEGVDLDFPSLQVGPRLQRGPGLSAVAAVSAEAEGEGTGAVKARAWYLASALGAVPPASLTAASCSGWVWVCTATVVGGALPAATAAPPGAAAEPATAEVAGLHAAVAASAASFAARDAR